MKSHNKIRTKQWIFFYWRTQCNNDKSSSLYHAQANQKLVLFLKVSNRNWKCQIYFLFEKAEFTKGKSKTPKITFPLDTVVKCNSHLKERMQNPKMPSRQTEMVINCYSDKGKLCLISTRAFNTCGINISNMAIENTKLTTELPGTILTSPLSQHINLVL